MAEQMTNVPMNSAMLASIYRIPAAQIKARMIIAMKPTMSMRKASMSPLRVVIIKILTAIRSGY